MLFLIDVEGVDEDQEVTLLAPNSNRISLLPGYNPKLMGWLGPLTGVIFGVLTVVLSSLFMVTLGGPMYLGMREYSGVFEIDSLEDLLFENSSQAREDTIPFPPARRYSNVSKGPNRRRQFYPYRPDQYKRINYRNKEQHQQPPGKHLNPWKELRS